MVDKEYFGPDDDDEEMIKKYVSRHRSSSQHYYLEDEEKKEALLKFMKQEHKQLKAKSDSFKELNYLFYKLHVWKDSFYKPIRSGNVQGAIFILLCISFSSSIFIYEKIFLLFLILLKWLGSISPLLFVF